MMPRPKVKRLAIAVIVIVFVIAGSSWFVTSRGGLVNVLNLSPDRDSSTPATQNGLTLTAVTLNEPDLDGLPTFQFNGVKEYLSGLAGVWIAAPQEQGDPSKLFSITAKTSVGDVFSPDWRMTSDPTYSIENPNLPNYLLIVLPAGYSNDCHWIDLNVTAPNGRTSRWRITRLPRMQHILPPPVKVQETVEKDGIRVSADAGRSGSMIWFRLRPILPANSHQWDFNYLGEWMEWEPYGYAPQPHQSNPILSREGHFTADMEKAVRGIIDSVGETPYQSSCHFVQVKCELRQFETYDETVVFHNLDIAHDTDEPPSETAYWFTLTRPQSITTPSGIRITLPVQGRPPTPTCEELNFAFQVEPSAKSNTLPQSPLVRTYSKPVSLDCLLPSPFDSYGLMYESGPLHHCEVKNESGFPPVYPKRLKDFSIIIRQRVDLQTIPMTFTVPVKDPAPKAGPKLNTP